MFDVLRLLKSLNLRKYCRFFKENDIDGRTLVNCLSVEDVTELGIPLTSKARILLEEITKMKETNEGETISETMSELSVDS